MDAATRSALLIAIARSREWVDAIIADRTTDFTMIAKRENLAERHVRFLAPLAYLSPRIAKAIVHRDHIAIKLRQGDDGDEPGEAENAPLLWIPFTPNLPLRKGVAHAPSARDAMDEATRSALLIAIAGSREWVDAIIADRTTDFSTISEREKLAERHVRFLAPLAYLSPRIVEAIAEGRAPADLTVTRLARGLPMVWAEQEKQLGFA